MLTLNRQNLRTWCGALATGRVRAGSSKRYATASVPSRPEEWCYSTNLGARIRIRSLSFGDRDAVAAFSKAISDQSLLRLAHALGSGIGGGLHWKEKPAGLVMHQFERHLALHALVLGVRMDEHLGAHVEPVKDLVGLTFCAPMMELPGACIEAGTAFVRGAPVPGLLHGLETARIEAAVMRGFSLLVCCPRDAWAKDVLQQVCDSKGVDMKTRLVLVRGFEPLSWAPRCEIDLKPLIKENARLH